MGRCKTGYDLSQFKQFELELGVWGGLDLRLRWYYIPPGHFYKEHCGSMFSPLRQEYGLTSPMPLGIFGSFQHFQILTKVGGREWGPGWVQREPALQASQASGAAWAFPKAPWVGILLSKGLRPDDDFSRRLVGQAVRERVEALWGFGAPLSQREPSGQIARLWGFGQHVTR